MDIKKLVNEARNSISDYCLTECKGYCCRKSYFLVMTKIQAKIFTHDKINDYLDKGILTVGEDGKYSFNLGKNNGVCPSFDPITFKCSIYDNENKPDICSEFPLFVDFDLKTFSLSSGCPAIKDNKLYPYISALLQNGFSKK